MDAQGEQKVKHKVVTICAVQKRHSKGTLKGEQWAVGAHAASDRPIQLKLLLALLLNICTCQSSETH